MNKDEILTFLNSNPACHLATVDGDKPHVRGILIYHADENGIIFHTGSMKDLYKQLSVNPNVELCFNDLRENIQIRVSGTATLVEDEELKKQIVANREFLKPWIEERGYDMLAVFIVKNCIATIWTIHKNFEPKTYIKL